VDWFDKFSIPHAKRVLYVDEEMSQRTLKRRIRRLAAGAKLDTKDLEFRVLSGAGLQCEGEQITSFLKQLIADGFEPDVVIVETLRSVLVGDENSAQDVRKFWKSIEPFRQHNMTLIVSHHMRKPQFGSTSARYRASGSMDLIGGPDTALAVERVGNKNLTKLSHIKCRNAEEGDPFVVSLQNQGEDENCPVVFRLEDAGTPKGTAQRANEQLTDRIVEYLETLPDRIATTQQMNEYFAKDGVTPSCLEKAHECLKMNPRIRKPRRGVWQLLDEAEQAEDVSADPPPFIGMAVAAASYEPPRRETTGLAEAEALPEAQVIACIAQDTG
jgi:archaellum biogenesis ATPase FlaH